MARKKQVPQTPQTSRIRKVITAGIELITTAGTPSKATTVSIPLDVNERDTQTVTDEVNEPDEGNGSVSIRCCIYHI